MNEYLAQAKQFLVDCNAEMEIKFLCKTNPTWDEKLHNCYWFTITTPKGKYSGKTVLCGDFEQAVRDADRNDFVFIDSPYAPLKATSFDKYTATGFAKEEHERLACVFSDLDVAAA